MFNAASLVKYLAQNPELLTSLSGSGRGVNMSSGQH
jgi:hypothetical protein